MVTNLGTFVFSQNLATSKIWGCRFQIWQKFFENSSPKISKWDFFCQKYPNKAFLVPNLNIFVFWQNLQLGKFDAGDFKYSNSFLKTNLAQKYLTKAFLVTNLGIFFISKIFAIRQIQGCWFQIWQYHFQNPAQKYPNKVFLVPNLDVFVFLENFAIRQIRECWFQTWQ